MAVEMIVLKDRSEWLKARIRIGGSDASAIVGMNPYKTNVDLWMEKTGQTQPEDISDKPYVQYGNQAEMHLRGLFRLDYPQYSVNYVENNMWINERFPWAHASLDGWIEDKQGRKGILEIKTTEILQSMQKEKWNQQIPDNYYIQCLWYMAVCEADFCVLKAQLRSVFGGQPYLQTKHYVIDREEVQEDIDYLMHEAERFWGYVQRKERPPLRLPLV